MCHRISLVLLLIVALTWKPIAAYYSNKEQWSTCAYPVGLWYMVVALGFNISLVLSLVTHSLVPFRRLVCGLAMATLPVLVQCFLLGWNFLGTIWVVLTICSDSDCVPSKQMPDPVYEVILEVFASYFLWLLASIIVLLSMLEVVYSSRAGLSEL